MANIVTQWVGEALRDVAAAQVDRVVVRTNLGTMVLKKPIATSGEVAMERPGAGSYVTKLLSPRIEVYMTGDTSPSITYTPGDLPNPTLADTGIAGTAVAALAVVGSLSVLRKLLS